MFIIMSQNYFTLCRTFSCEQHAKWRRSTMKWQKVEQQRAPVAPSEPLQCAGSPPGCSGGSFEARLAHKQGKHLLADVPSKLREVTNAQNDTDNHACTQTVYFKLSISNGGILKLQERN